jgi:hypothetical protein
MARRYIMQDGPTRAKGQAAPVREMAEKEPLTPANGHIPKRLPKEKPGRFDGAEGWTFIVLNRDDRGILASCRPVTEVALDVDTWQDTQKFARWLAGEKVIVVLPGHGPGRKQAKDVAYQCELAKASRVVRFTIPGLGRKDMPDLAAWIERHPSHSLESHIGLLKPWLPGYVDIDPGEEEDEEEGPRDQVGDIDQAAFHGVLGRLAQAIQPHTEASSLFVLMHLIGFFGIAAGKKPHFRWSQSNQYLNLFIGIIGPTGWGRKGTAARNAKDIFRKVDQEFVKHQIGGGLNSGAGLLKALRDASGTDEGVKDKRFLYLESEFASVLMQGHRESDPMLCHLRDFFDGVEVVRSNTKDHPTKVTGAHVGLVGHCSPEELRFQLNDVDKANGTANRVLWIYGMRKHRLDFEEGDGIFDALDNFLTPLLEELKAAVEFAAIDRRIGLTSKAAAQWKEMYKDLDWIPPGRIGAFFVRAPLIIRKVAAIFALADLTDTVECIHLDAAMAIWRHSEKSLRWIFNEDIDPKSEELMKALKDAPDGLTKTQIIKEVYNGNVEVKVLDQLLERLMTHHAIEKKRDAPKGGRPATRFLPYRW